MRYKGRSATLSPLGPRLQADVITALAGPVAEARLSKRSLHEVALAGGGRLDYQRVKMIVADYLGVDIAATQLQLVGDLECATRILVALEWDRILRLASTLRDRGQLDGLEAHEIIVAGDTSRKAAILALRQVVKEIERVHSRGPGAAGVSGPDALDALTRIVELVNRLARTPPQRDGAE